MYKIDRRRGSINRILGRTLILFLNFVNSRFALLPTINTAVDSIQYFQKITMGPKLRAIAPKRKKVESSSDSSDDEILNAKDLQFVLEKV